MDKCFDEGKELKWSEIVSKYPAKWVLFSKANFDGVDIESGIVLKILADEELQDFLEKNYQDVVYYTRTTEEIGQAGGYIHGELVNA